MSSLVRDLLDPRAYPDPRPASVSLKETHISQVFLTDREVFKVKRAVSFGFLDFSTPALRRAACEAEVTLNRRLAPDVYHGTVALRRGADGRYTFTGDGEVVDTAVHMVRLPDRWSALSRLQNGLLSGADIDRVAARLARFHAEVRSDAETASYASPEAVARVVEENLTDLAQAMNEHMSAAESGELVRWQREFLRSHRAFFEARAASGRSREGHGDLRLEHVYLDDAGAVTVIDCVEFSPRYRCADVCSDVAFLAMDLSLHGRVDLAERFLARYARESDDHDLFALVDFYSAYRACVRAKISAMVERSPDASEDVRARACQECRRYLLLALAADRRSLLSPCVVAVGGVIASGKSTVSDWLCGELGAATVDADRTRKHMLGVAHTQKVHDGTWQGAYDPAFTEKVYEEVLRRADVVLASGRPVVIDASFRSRTMRAQARALAEKRGVPFRFVECATPREVCRERLREREKGASVSDGRLAIFDDFCARFEPVTELPAEVHVTVDASRPRGELYARLRERLDVWPRGLTG